MFVEVLVEQCGDIVVLQIGVVVMLAVDYNEQKEQQHDVEQNLTTSRVAL